MNWHIEEADDLPASLTTSHRREANLLWYGPSALFVVREQAKIIGAIRAAIRHHETLRHGLITDLMVDESVSGTELADVLIAHAEQFLRGHEVTKIDAIVVDGIGLAEHFLRAGYWASRKTVVIEWDLGKLPSAPPTVFPNLTFDLVTKPDAEEVADFILTSYQPYWQWWKDDLSDRLWERIDYPAKEPDEVTRENAEANRTKVTEMLRTFNREIPQRMVIARGEGSIIGLCDAKAVPNANTFDWFVMLTRNHPGKGFGHALLLPALHWLREQGLAKARATLTSGMDDYDPTVYLATQTGGKILGEFLNLVKRTV